MRLLNHLIACPFLVIFTALASSSHLRAESCTTTGYLTVASILTRKDNQGECHHRYFISINDRGREHLVPLAFRHAPSTTLAAGRVRVSGIRRERGFLLATAGRRHLRRTAAKTDRSSCKLSFAPAQFRAAAAAVGVPVPVKFSSRPGAPATLYLNFGGYITPFWAAGTPRAVPGYDLDGNPAAFNEREIASIREIAQVVAEKFAPFNLNVTTINPGNLTAYKTARIDIGGDGSWVGLDDGEAPAGVGVGTFDRGGKLNISYVFPKVLGNSGASEFGDVIAHEAGHTFQLFHQSNYDKSGNLIAEYGAGQADGDSPIMGSHWGARRTLWWYGMPFGGYKTYQDDIAILSSLTINKFGYAPDDHGGTPQSSSPLSVDAGGSISGSGVIERINDVDAFRLSTNGGPVFLSVRPPTLGRTLNLKLILKNSAGAVVDSADTAYLGESLSFVSQPLPAGRYYLFVSSHGDYGDIGSYTISGFVMPRCGEVACPPAARVNGDYERTGYTVFVNNTNNSDWDLVNQVCGPYLSVVAHGQDSISYLHLTAIGRDGVPNAEYEIYDINAGSQWYNDQPLSFKSTLSLSSDSPLTVTQLFRNNYTSGVEVIRSLKVVFSKEGNIGLRYHRKNPFDGPDFLSVVFDVSCQFS